MVPEERGGSASVIYYTAAPDETNELTFIGSGTEPASLRDSIPIVPGEGCSRESTGSVSCRSSRAVISAGDGNDSVRIEGRLSVYASGDDGDDTVRGGEGITRLLGGSGDDRLEGGGGTTTLDGGAGGDVMSGTSDVHQNDTVSYRDRTRGVRVDLDGSADDGEPGEGDLVASGVERIEGGRGADTLTGGDRRDLLLGLAGDDVIRGGGGPDYLDSGAGADTVSGGSGDDGLTGGRDQQPNRLFGGPGDDSLTGGSGRDLLDGGTGTDESLAGGGDTTRARDGFMDEVACAIGRPAGTAIVDQADYTEACRTIRRSGAPAAVLLGAGLPYEQTDVVQAFLACPQDARGGCRGTVAASVPGAHLGRALFRLAPEARHSVVRFRLTPSARRELERRRRLRVFLVLATRDARGGRRVLRRAHTVLLNPDLP